MRGTNEISLKNLTYRIPKGNIPWNKGRRGGFVGLRKDISSQRFGKLIAIKFHSRKERLDKGFRYYWVFKCDCGKETIKDMSKVTTGYTTSCGCYLRKLQKTVAEGKFKTHGLSKKRFWSIFNNIKARCKNPNNNRFVRYGGRGIQCLWSNFEEYRDDMYKSYLDHVTEFGVKNTTIDRIDNDGNYCKENCRWATYKEQANNR